LSGRGTPLLIGTARVVNARVDRYSTVVVDHHYSVPDHLVGKLVVVKIYSVRIQCFYEETKVAEHDRLVGCHEWRLGLVHYLETLKKKPGALAGSTALAQAQSHIKKIYETYYTRREKDFVELLQYIRDEDNLEEVERSIKQLDNLHPSHVTTDKVKAICANGRETPPPPLLHSQASKPFCSRPRRTSKKPTRKRCVTRSFWHNCCKKNVMRSMRLRGITGFVAKFTHKKYLEDLSVVICPRMRKRS
jgi:hypothetical protein